MKQKTETFNTLMSAFAYRYDLNKVFDDFLTLCICSFSQNPKTGMSYMEDEYLKTINKYDKEAIKCFPKLLALLVNEMEMRHNSSGGNDVLGGFFEEHLYSKAKAQFFTPWSLCTMMAKMMGDLKNKEPQHIIDPCCGSGRNLIAGAWEFGPKHHYYGIDIDPLCAKMTTINLFLNGTFHSEVMCADTLAVDDFRFSYKISFLPFGIFRVDEKEKSVLWNRYKKSFTKKSNPPEFDSKKTDTFTNEYSQLKLF